jgi:hypothetical protein
LLRTSVALHTSTSACINLTMSNLSPDDEGLRNRNIPRERTGPPVPPKSNDTQPLPAYKPAQSTHKPLPPTPDHDKLWGGHAGASSVKPLPPIPARSRLKMTLLWVAAFSVWFLLTVLLLPNITEKDAMPGLNRWLRKLLSRALGSRAENDT